MAADHTIDASENLTVFQTLAFITASGLVETVEVTLPGGDFSPRKLQIVGSAAWNIASTVGGIVANEYLLVPKDVFQSLTLTTGTSITFEVQAVAGTILYVQLIR